MEKDGREELTGLMDMLCELVEWLKLVENPHEAWSVFVNFREIWCKVLGGLKRVGASEKCLNEMEYSYWQVRKYIYECFGLIVIEDC